MTAPAVSENKVPPRERILAAARDLFYRRGIRAVGVDAIAESAGTNKMTLYRHFASKDALVADYLRGLASEELGAWDVLDAQHPGDPKAQLRSWLARMGEHAADPAERGCALANAAVEIPEKEHPARCVIETHKNAYRDRLVALCRAAGAKQPDALADELFLLLEGARVCCQSLGPGGPGSKLVQLGETIIEAHTR